MAFRFYRDTRANYWTCSGFADWIRKTFTSTPKPISGTAEEWRDWNNAAKLNNKFIYWFTEDFLNDLQDIVLFPADVWHSIRVYFRNRFYTRTHAVVTSLPRGEWHESEELLLHANFQILVDFIEIETAYQHLWSEEGRKEYKEKYSWWERNNPFKQWRSREFGLKHIDWAMSLVHDEGGGVRPDDPLYGKPTSQAMSACEQLELYLWWTDVRPNRPDPMDLSGYMDAWRAKKEKKELQGKGDIWNMLTEPMTNEYRATLDRSWAIERAQEEEDTEMLIRLIKIRSHLWT